MQCSIASCVSCGNWWCLNLARVCCFPMFYRAVCHCRLRPEACGTPVKKKKKKTLRCSFLSHIEVELASPPRTSWHSNGKGVDFAQTSQSCSLWKVRIVEHGSPPPLFIFMSTIFCCSTKIWAKKLCDPDYVASTIQEQFSLQMYYKMQLSWRQFFFPLLTLSCGV